MSIPAPARAPRAAWTLVALVGLQSLAISGLSALLPAYLARQGAPASLVGFAFTTWAVARGAFGLLAGRLYARLGPRRLLTGSFALFAGTTLGYALFPEPRALVALRLGQGVAAGFFWTSILAAAGEASAPEARLAALARVNVVYAATGLASNLAAGWVAATWSPDTWFWLESALLALGGVPLAASLPARAGPPAASTPATPGPGATLGPRSRRQAVLAALAGLPAAIPAVGAPVLLTRAGAGYRLVGLVAAGMVLANIAAQVPAGRLAARLGEARLLAGLGGLSAGLLVLLSSARSPAAVAALVIPLSGALTLTGLTWLSWAQAGVPPDSVGAVTGLLRGLGDLSAVAAYTAFGAVAAHLRPALGVLALVALGTGVGALRLDAVGPSAHPRPTPLAGGARGRAHAGPPRRRPRPPHANWPRRLREP
jgi:predicted MFS family arabinose efflux permease